ELDDEDRHKSSNASVTRRTRDEVRLLLSARCRTGTRHGRTPAVGRVDSRHTQGNILSILAQVLLVDHAILADQERHDSGVPEFAGEGQDGEVAGSHENSIVVTVEVRRVTSVARSHGFREIPKLAERTHRLALRYRPVQPVLLTRVTY